MVLAALSLALQLSALSQTPAVSAPDRVFTSEGRAHVGRIVGDLEGGLEFEDVHGSRYAIPFAVIEGIERGGVPMPSPRRPVLEPVSPELSERLSLAIEVWDLERRRDQVSYRNAALLTGVGVLTAVLGFTLLGGEAGEIVGAVGVAQATGGAIGLGYGIWRERQLSARSAEVQERLSAIRGRAAAAAISLRF